MREKARIGELQTADVTEAHRQARIHPDDWHLLGCQVISGGEVFINTVGTFGKASASYYWSRVAAAVGRLAQYLVADVATTWHTLVADDYSLECGGSEYRRGLLTFFVLCVALGVPLSWHKTSGGDVLVWVEFVEESYPTPHIHEQMTTSNYGYDTAYNFTHNNIMLEPNAMNNIDTVAHMNVHNTQY